MQAVEIQIIKIIEIQIMKNANVKMQLWKVQNYLLVTHVSASYISIHMNWI